MLVPPDFPQARPERLSQRPLPADHQAPARVVLAQLGEDLG